MRRRLAVILLGAVIVGAVAYLGLSHASPTPTPAGYLALGDSISFGYREPDTLPTPVYSDPASFTGFPEDVGTALGLPVVNAACSGETSHELLQTDVVGIACPLHVSYTESQIQFATTYLRYHPNTKLVTVMIGINDVLVCQNETADHCGRELPGVLSQLSTNESTTLSDIRSVYGGTVVIVNYYPIVSFGTDDVPSVNEAVDKVASQYHAIVANGWGAFESAAAGTNGNVCRAGLLTQLTSGGCGIHPSAAGQALLALAVEEAVRGDASVTTTPPPSCPRGFRRGPTGVCVSG
jgi:lysophospholipase L1-like esterase